ncbi:MAG: YbaB/EbfC family nucleoid-associated protein [Chthoniobacterales bacterium]
MNIQKMLKQAQEMQSKLASTQADLANKSVEGSSGGGKVTVTANGASDIPALKIAPPVVAPEDVELLEDLVLAAINDASDKAKELAAAEMGKVTGGMNIPGLGF